MRRCWSDRRGSQGRKSPRRIGARAFRLRGASVAPHRRRRSAPPLRAARARPLLLAAGPASADALRYASSLASAVVHEARSTILLCRGRAVGSGRARITPGGGARLTRWCRETARSIPAVGRLRVVDHEFPHMQAANAEVVDLDGAKACAADRQAADDQAANGERANGNSSDRECSDGEGADPLGLDRLRADGLGANGLGADSGRQRASRRRSSTRFSIRHLYVGGEWLSIRPDGLTLCIGCGGRSGVAGGWTGDRTPCRRAHAYSPTSWQCRQPPPHPRPSDEADPDAAADRTNCESRPCRSTPVIVRDPLRPPSALESSHPQIGAFRQDGVLAEHSVPPIIDAQVRFCTAAARGMSHADGSNDKSPQRERQDDRGVLGRPGRVSEARASTDRHPDRW